MGTPTKKRKINVSEKSQKYFKLTREENGKIYYECQICCASVVGTQKRNLGSHLQHMHADIYNDEICHNGNSIKFKRQKLLLDCVEMISVNGRAFKCLNDSAILSMNEELLNELHLAGRDVFLKDPNLREIKSLLKTVAGKVKEKIQMECKGLPLSMMIDACTIRGRGILGVSIQYVLNGMLVVRSIGMIELKDSHTAEYLCNVITQRLHEFHIDCRQIITITTDNGANVVKTVKDMDGFLQKVTDEAQSIPQTPRKDKNSHSENQISDDDAIEQEIEAALALPDDEVTEEDAYTILFDESDRAIQEKNDMLLSELTAQLADNGVDIDWSIVGLQCDTHTLQLAVNDAVKATTLSNQNVLKLCQKVAVYLRVPSTRRILEYAGIACKKPSIKNATRWCSEYLMVNILISILFHMGVNFHILFFI